MNIHQNARLTPKGRSPFGSMQKNSLPRDVASGPFAESAAAVVRSPG